MRKRQRGSTGAAQPLERRRSLAIFAAGVAGTSVLAACVSQDQYDARAAQKEAMESSNRALERKLARAARAAAPVARAETEAAGHVAALAATALSGGAPEAPARPNVPTSFNPDIKTAQIDPAAYVDPEASVIGNVVLSPSVYVAPGASARGDEGQPTFVGRGGNLQDGVGLHALETFDDGKFIDANQVTVNGQRHAVYIGDNVSLAHQSHVHGPARVGHDTLVGMPAMVFRATIGSGVVVEPGALIMGVTIPDGRYVPASTVIASQTDADALPPITNAYGLKDSDQAVLRASQQLAAGYDGRAGGHE